MFRRLSRWLVAVLVITSESSSAAQAVVAPGEPNRREPSVSAAPPVDTLPAPADAPGLEVEPEEPSRLWWLPRALLFVPRLAVEAINAPVRGGLYVSDRYQVIERVEDVLFNDARTFGVYPIASYDSGFGVSAGAKLVHRDIFGARESVGLKALYGGRFNQEYALRLGTGDRLASVRGSLEAELQRRPKERFFGIGNGDVIAAGELDRLIDPTVDDRAVSSRFRADSAIAHVELDVDIAAGVFAAGRGRLERRSFGAAPKLSGDAALGDVYDPAAVVGFDDTIDTGYGELELRFDTRRPSNLFASSAVPSRGFLAAGRVGYAAPIGDDRADFFRYELDLQAYVDLYEGTRALGFRVFAVQVDAEVDEIAFVHLPRLGGETLLRGYQTDRFRDRALWLASAEYKWELNPKYLAGYLFVDAGRVESSLADAALDDLRVGFGAGVQVHTLSSFVLRAHIASSRDGGLFFNLDFDPVSSGRVRQ